MFARDKHSSLLRKFVNYGWKKFYNIGPWIQKVKNQFNGRTCTTYFAGKYRLLNGIKRCHDTQHNGLIYDNQQNSIACHYAECLNFFNPECHYAECCHAECHYVECRGTV